mmetsp:Transcript_3396/g.8169  ORF Transcript_3396/g.8169 Transcript_3396/m.8169 type:complete len:94 (+) Transcript_3396:1943-2224(+)
MHESMTLQDTVGAGVGALVGRAVGRNVGRRVGASVGACVGEEVGALCASAQFDNRLPHTPISVADASKQSVWKKLPRLQNAQPLARHAWQSRL